MQGISHQVTEGVAWVQSHINPGKKRVDRSVRAFLSEVIETVQVLDRPGKFLSRRQSFGNGWERGIDDRLHLTIHEADQVIGRSFSLLQLFEELLGVDRA